MEAFLKTKEGRRYSGYRIVKSAFAPAIDAGLKERLRDLGYEAFGFDELLAGV